MEQLPVSEFWLYLIFVVIVIVVSFVAYAKYKLLPKAELLALIDRIIANDEQLIPTVPPEDAEKLRIKNQALGFLRRAIEEGWVPGVYEERITEALKIKRR